MMPDQTTGFDHEHHQRPDLLFHNHAGLEVNFQRYGPCPGRVPQVVASGRIGQQPPSPHSSPTGSHSSGAAMGSYRHEPSERRAASTTRMPLPNPNPASRQRPSGRKLRSECRAFRCEAIHRWNREIVRVWTAFSVQTKETAKLPRNLTTAEIETVNKK